MRRRTINFWTPVLYHEQVGEVTLGNPKLERFTGDFQWLALIRSIHWDVRFNQMYLGSQHGVSIGNIDRVMFDTGTVYILVPDFVMQQVVAKYPFLYPDTRIPGKFVTNCRNMHRIEDVIFAIQWKNFTVSKSNLFVPMFGHKCAFGLKSHRHSKIVLGTVFHTQFVVAYDYDMYAVGLATAVH